MDKKDIENYYKEHSFEETALFFKIGKKKLNTYFEIFNIPKKTKGGQNRLIKNHDLNDRWDYYNEQITNTSKIKNICKKTGKIFYDWYNEGGYLSNHLKSLNIEVPNLNDRRKFQMETGLLWWEQYFDYIIEGVNTKKCSLCDWLTLDVENNTGAYYQHLNNCHNITNLKEHIKTYPDDYFFLQNIIKKNEYKEKEVDYIVCKECGEKFKKITGTHVRNVHNMTLHDYRVKHGNTLSDTTRKVFSDNMKNTNENSDMFTKISKPHQEIIDILMMYHIPNIIINDRKVLSGKELDIYLPDNNLAIEMNGLKHHTELFGGKISTYHIEKTKGCQNKNIRLIHIFDDEWNNKKNICISKLLSILKVNKNQSIYARKCVIKEINSEIKNTFLNKNHIQGEDKSNIKLGMFHEDTLVSVMTFSNSFNMTNAVSINNQWNLSRFASDISLNVIGGAGKLLSYFIKNYKPKSIISFADMRWSEMNDNLYTKLGFNLVNIGNPNYSYYNVKLYGNVRIHKFSWGKKSILKKYPEMDSNKTEWELMQELGFDRVWDCGLLKYELNF
jgi:Pyruvate/2-oxoacid:ferredoxin oxidoreductase delta subunit